RGTGSVSAPCRTGLRRRFRGRRRAPACRRRRTPVPRSRLRPSRAWRRQTTRQHDAWAVPPKGDVGRTTLGRERSASNGSGPVSGRAVVPLAPVGTLSTGHLSRLAKRFKPLSTWRLGAGGAPV